jgi:hypothetical protein
VKAFSISLSFLTRKKLDGEFAPACVTQQRHQCIEPAAALVDDVGVCRYVGRSAAATKAIIHQTNNAKART